MLALFLPGPDGARPCHGDDARFAQDPRLRELVLFHEYFHGETGKGLGAAHQTGWTALVARCAEELAQKRAGVKVGEANLLQAPLQAARPRARKPAR